MARLEHAVDWHGLRFIAGVLAAVVMLGTGAWWGAQLAAPLLYSAQTPLTLAAPAQLALSTTTPERIINQLSIGQAVPKAGKFIVADLVHMELTLYQDGAATATYPILTKGKPGTPYETPSGVYSVLTKEQNHFNYGEQVNMPWSMEFYGNYFIHGWPTYADGSPVPSGYSGGCIRLSTPDAQKVYAFADTGTGVFVYDTGAATSAPPLILGAVPLPSVSSGSYLVADLDTGDVYAEQGAEDARPQGSLTTFMTALVANETIMFDHPVAVPDGAVASTSDAGATDTFVVGDLLYPLLMQNDNRVADVLAQYYGTHAFVAWMNSEAKALDMTSTNYQNPDDSALNTSTAEDVYRLLHYLAFKKSFVLTIASTTRKTIVAKSGARFAIDNTTTSTEDSAEVVPVVVDDQTRRIAVIVLGSPSEASDTTALSTWIAQAAQDGAQTACASCALPTYRRIAL